MKLTLDTLPMYCHVDGDCLLWAQGVNGRGYPQAAIDGKGRMVRRYIVGTLLGRDIAGKVVHARCFNALCCAPDHLMAVSKGHVMTRSYQANRRHVHIEYSARLERSMAAGWAKLDWDTVREIRAVPPDVSHSETARQFNIHPKTARNIRMGLTWKVNARNNSVWTWAQNCGRVAA